MFKTAIKSLLGHKLRLLITVLAIVLGVGFMAGTFVLTDTLGKSFDDLFTSSGRNVDAVVRAKSIIDAANQQGAIRSDIDPGLANTIASVPGVQAAEASVSSLAIPIDRKGKAVGGGGAPNLAFNWSSVPQLNRFDLAAGKAPVGPHQVVIGGSVAKDGDYKVGDTIPIQTLGGTIKPKVTGIATFNGADSLVGATFVLMDTTSAIKAFSFGQQVQQIEVVAKPGVTQQALTTRIQSVLPANIEAITGTAQIDENQSDAKDQLSQFNQVLSGFAFVSLIAGAFLIANTFGIIVAQRTRELALLRALGARRRQVLNSVVLEAGAIGLVSSILGLIGGVGLALVLFAAFKALGVELPSTAPVVAPRTIIIAISLGLVITVLSALAPALRASRVPPVAALRDVDIDTSAGSRLRLVIGVILAAAGVFTLVSGATGKSLANVLIGVVVLFAALVVLGPRIAPFITRTLGAGFPRLAGMPGRLAKENTARTPKRSASTASALLLSVTIVTLLSVFAFSFGASINRASDKYLRADFQLDAGGFGFPTISPQVVQKVRELPDVAAASGVLTSSVGINGESRTIYGLEGKSLTKLFDVGLTDGSFANLGTDGIAVDNETAKANGWTVGRSVDVTFPDGMERTLAVRANYDNAGIIAQNSDGNFLVDTTLFKKYFPAQNQFVSRVVVKDAAGVSQAQVRTQLETVAADSASMKVRDKDEIKEENNRQLNQSLAVLVMLLVLSVVIGALGIANTLALAVFERTREIGLLRAVGATRRQVNVSIFLEAILLTLFGTILGLVLGVAGGSALIGTISDVIPTATVRVPIPFLVAILVVAFIIGVMASVIPAWRSSRLDVLKAIATE